MREAAESYVLKLMNRYNDAIYAYSPTFIIRPYYIDIDSYIHIFIY